jgi:hypothetical protein
MKNALLGIGLIGLDKQAAFLRGLTYNLMLTPNCMCRPYISLRVHLLHLISIMSFKLGHVSISERRIFLPLFLLCA